MNADLQELQRLTQRVCAVVDQADKRRETPAMAKVLAAARELWAAVDHVVAIEKYVPPAPKAGEPDQVEPQRPEAPAWPAIGDEVVVEVSRQHMKRGRVKYFYKHLDEDAAWCESQWGSFEALVSECKRP